LGYDPFLILIMSSITDIKFVLTWKAFNIFCQKFHIPEDVHPQLPSPNHTIHEMHVGKIEPFLCLIGMSRNYTLDKDTYPTFLRDDGTVADPTKVKVKEQERAEEEAKLLDFTVGRGNANQVDFIADGGQKVKTKIATGVIMVAGENVVAERPKRLRKKRQAATDASGSSHPLKKLKGDYRASSEATICGKSLSALKELLASSMLNVEVGVAAVPTLPMITFSLYVVISSVITEVVVTSHAINIPLVSEMGVKALRAPFIPPSKISRWTLKKFNVGTARQACLNAKVRMRTEYCLSEMKRLEFECEKQADLLKVSAFEAVEKMRASFRKMVLELEATCFGLRGQVSCNDRLKEQIEEFQDAQMNIVTDKVAKLDADLLEMALHLEEIFYPHLHNTISGQRWLLTNGLKLIIIKCLKSQEYLSALGAAIICAIEKGMQDGLSVGRSLEDVPAYNPSAEADYTFAFQRLREVDFPLLAKLKSHKDASNADVIDLLFLEVSLDVTHSLVERIRENIAAQRSALIGVWTPLVDPLSVENLVGVASTSDSMAVTIATTTSLSVTFAFASTVPPITIEDYEIIGTDDLEDAQRSGQGEAASFPNKVEFKKEELDTTLERDPPS
nr:hypothetical protein [Tanacetum cinerariifolium]